MLFQTVSQFHVKKPSMCNLYSARVCFCVCECQVSRGEAWSKTAQVGLFPAKAEYTWQWFVWPWVNTLTTVADGARQMRSWVTSAAQCVDRPGCTECKYNISRRRARCHGENEWTADPHWAPRGVSEMDYLRGFAVFLGPWNERVLYVDERGCEVRGG